MVGLPSAGLYNIINQQQQMLRNVPMYINPMIKFANQPPFFLKKKRKHCRYGLMFHVLPTAPRVFFSCLFCIKIVIKFRKVSTCA